MNTSEILGLILLFIGFGVRLGSRFIKLEDRGLSRNTIALSGGVATLAGIVFFFFLNF